MRDADAWAYPDCRETVRPTVPAELVPWALRAAREQHADRHPATPRRGAAALVCSGQVTVTVRDRP